MALAATPTAAVDAVPLTVAQRATLDRVVAYLNDIDSVEARFVQISAGGIAEGQIYLDRPGRMRLEYNPPVPVLMVAKSPWLMYVDHELKQTSFVPLSSTPAAILLRESIKLDDTLVVTDVERALNAVRVTVAQADHPEAGTLTLVLQDQPLRLVKWRVVDAQGEVIDVALIDARFGVPLDSELFAVIDPYLETRREN